MRRSAKPAQSPTRTRLRARQPAAAWLVAVALACLSLPAAAAGPAPTDPAASTDVGAMWREANAKLATSDYPGAIALLTRIYEQIAQDPDARMLRLRVRWALHEAHVGAYGVDADAQHLLVARDLLRNGMDDFGADDAQLRTRSEAALAQLEVRIATLEGERRDRDAATQQRLDDQRAAQAEQQRRDEARAATEPSPPPPEAATADDARHPRRGLLIGGAVAGGIGVVGLALLGGGFGSATRAVHTFETDPERRDDARSDIHRGNAIGIAGAVVAAVGLTTAAILIPLSLRRSSPANARASRSRAFVWVGSGIGMPARFGWSATNVRASHRAR